jgi:hypothetical protein
MRGVGEKLLYSGGEPLKQLPILFAAKIKLLHLAGKFIPGGSLLVLTK